MNDEFVIICIIDMRCKHVESYYIYIRVSGMKESICTILYIEVNVEIIVTMIFTIATVYHTVCE